MTTTDEWTELEITYAIRQQIKRGAKTGNWHVQFYKTRFAYQRMVRRSNP